MLNLTPLILVFPLLGFITIGLFGKGWPKALIAWVACAMIFLAFGAALIDFVSMLGQSTAGRYSDIVIFTWVNSGSLSINFGLLSDPLSAVMLLIVTGVGFLIHVYSTSYMADDEGYWRFFAFLNLFILAMTLLVAADNFLFLLVGWAGVGLVSFLLIGFWYTRPRAVAAAQKAFVVNVIGDFGMMVAIFLLFKFFGTLNYREILTSPTSMVGMTLQSLVARNVAAVTIIALLLLVAAAAKSAQLPLYVWLPDAMEGPTPVSALIHAATMVTAGVYLVARASSIFAAVPNTLIVVGIMGGASALFAATVACAQTDIKRVLAYSTMSQLAYMFMGEAAGGFSTGIFHLTTHAYFKALLFLCAGAVIHAVGGEQDLRKLGGLRARLPYTFWMFVIGGLSLCAIVPFAGFWSKDSILGAVLATAEKSADPVWWVLYGVGILTAGLTGFYTFRLIFTVFLGDYRGTAVESPGRGDPLANVHEVGPVMLVPMVILAVLSTVGGFYGLPFANSIGTFLAPVLGTSPALSGSAAWFSALLGLASAGVGIGIAWVLYGQRQPVFATTRSVVTRVVEHGYYLENLLNFLLVVPTIFLGDALRGIFEDTLFEGGTRGIAGTVAATSRGLRRLQTGYVRNYALAILVGAVLILLFYVIRP
ncbi:MAG: NADH-quinone oxidoreductase subunit L [Ktedonobacterales bacterium]